LERSLCFSEHTKKVLFLICDYITEQRTLFG
jgi:hypothetical protein